MTFEEAKEKINELFTDPQVPGYSVGDFDPEFTGTIEDLEEIIESLEETYLPVSTDKLIPDYWIVSGQVFKNKERFVKQQMEFNPGDIRENWESSFDHFAIPVYRNPIFVSEYENGVKTSFVRKNKVLQEQLNTAKKALTEIDCSRYGMQFRRDRNPNVARQALAAIGGEND
ncbi:hypothetical protein QYM42_11760 [Lactococcus lactis]|uniref:hypothetical protein n=1 Tax=Lactococcus lactis TaxID=1358 RepID=UPI00265AEB21|nr:hypothetical protein [Lactococcus lactis]WKF73035.1 hypothetical protein QYM42_11760 [Lactococcus lactis]